MSKAVDVVDTLYEFLSNTLNALVAEQKMCCEFLWHSNYIQEHNNDKLRIYIDRRIAREEQDTLAVDVEDFGRVRYNSVGVCSISFFAPRSIDDSYRKMELIAQGLKNALRKERFTCFWVRNPTATPYAMENNSYRYNVTFSYEFDEII